VTNDEIKQQLLKDSKLLLNGEMSERLSNVINATFGTPEYAFLVDHIVEQGEDIYKVVIPPDVVARIEISRVDSNIPEILISDIESYRMALKQISKREKRMLPALMELIRNIDRRESTEK
jgi:hypothetical protein